MKLTGLHLLLTYQCTMECDHCFVWSSPRQHSTMTLEQVREILRQAQAVDSIKTIYFEGGEPFLYYPLLVQGVKCAARRGFEVGIVSNAYWATSVQDAEEWLRPFAGFVSDLSISCDHYHWGESMRRHYENARAAAEQLSIPLGSISIAQPEVVNAGYTLGQLPQGESAVMYRGRAAAKLASRALQHPWDEFTGCAHEDLREPGRVHVDPFGNVHICDGIVIGNVFHKSLEAICETYDPDAHPITGVLLEGGPAELVRRYALSHAETYADACHLCDDARRQMRIFFPETLIPNEMYGV